MSEMHPTRWTMTVVLVLFAVLSVTPNKTEPSAWERLAQLIFATIAVFSAVFDIATAVYSRNITRWQRRLRLFNATMLVFSALMILFGRDVFGIPRYEVPPNSLEIEQSNWCTGDAGC